MKNLFLFIFCMFFLWACPNKKAKDNLQHKQDKAANSTGVSGAEAEGAVINPPRESFDSLKTIPIGTPTMDTLKKNN